MISMPGIPASAEVRDKLRESGPVLLGFSRGKDSIAAWLALRESGVEVIPFHLYRVPGIRFERESLDYFEQIFETRIIELPHPALFRWLNGYVFQPPERCAVIDAAQLPSPTYEDIVDMLREDHGANAWYCDGVRACDSPVRRAAIKTHGVMKERRSDGRRVLKSHPVWDWQISNVREAMARNKIDLPVDYEWFAGTGNGGRSFDGLDVRFLGPLKEHAPDDYQRVLDWFPMAELELVRHGL